MDAALHDIPVFNDPGPSFETRAVGSAGAWLGRSFNRALHRAVPYTGSNKMKSGVRQIGPLCRGGGRSGRFCIELIWASKA
ncbi:unnamed protein product [Sphagnum balticum]